jgi:hypothetical protein
MVGPACSDAPTGASDSNETIVVSIVGANSDDAGVLLRVPHHVVSVEPTRSELEIGWAIDHEGGTRIVIIGDLAASGDHVIVRRRATPEQVQSEVIEVAGAEGQLLRASPVRAIARRLGS